MSAGVIDKARFAVTTWGLVQLMRMQARRHPEFREWLGRENLVAQVKIRDDSQGRYYVFNKGKVTSSRGQHPKPDVVMSFQDAAVAARVLRRKRDQLEFLNAAKTFQLEVSGDDHLVTWFTTALSKMLTAGNKYGTAMKDGTVRYTNNSNGGPVFVYVKDGRIVRITPMEFDESDAQPWTIRARGKEFSPPHRTTVSPHTLSLKSIIYSPDRLLYPMKRVDFDPNGAPGSTGPGGRNPQNRGISGYERVSWQEALDLVASEIKRVKREHGPGAIMSGSGSHHNWGAIGYWLSARVRFFNSIGWTPVAHNPDSWEGWFWGAIHHWGQSTRLGGGETFSTVEDCLKNAEMIVFWSSDPEATGGVYGAQEGTIRRKWLKELGIPLVHIDPYYTHTAGWLGGKWLAPRPGTDSALVLAIAYVWITENLYDKEYVAERTTGFDTWKSYVLGQDDGIAKTPEWQEAETGVPAKDVRALAREWGSKKTYLAPGGYVGFGGACRTATGTDWARGMVYLMAMQGLGKPGVNMGCLQQGAPLDTRFYFPGYAEGGMAGDLEATGMSLHLYQRMPQLLSVNPVKQAVPRLKIPEAIMDGHTDAYVSDGKTIEAQFAKFGYPAPGYSPARMYYKYGGSHIGTMVDTNRYARMYASESLEFVVNQSVWFEGEAKFADVILPACTNFERWDIGEFANPGGYAEHAFTQCNHRVAVLQHKCIEPLGESKSDFQIFLELAERLGLGNAFAEGSSEIDWCRRLFEATDVSRRHLLEGVPPEGLLRRAAAAGRTTRPGLLQLVRRGPAEGRAGAESPAGRLHRGMEARSADAVGAARVRSLESEALRPRRPGAPAHHDLPGVVGGTAHRRTLREVSPAAGHAASAFFVPHPSRRQGRGSERHRRAPSLDRWLPLLDGAPQPRGRQGPRHRTPRPGQAVQRPWRCVVRGGRYRAGSARVWSIPTNRLRSTTRSAHLAVLTTGAAA